MGQLLKIHEARNPATLKTSRKANIIFNVKIIGFNSENDRQYLPEALKAAVKLYEGINVNVDHPTDPSEPRSAYDRIGKLVNVRFVEGKGLYGDLWLNPSHELTGNVFSAAEKMPDQYGLSHNAQGEGETKNGVFIVSKITEVRSVDLVADPATTKSLSESKKMKKPKVKKLKEEKIKSVKGKTVKEAAKKPSSTKGKTMRVKESEDNEIKKKVTEALREADGEENDEELMAKADKIMEIFKEALDAEKVEEDDEEEKDTYEADGDSDSEDEEIIEEGEDVDEDDDEEVKEGEDVDEDEDEEKVEEGRKHRINKKLTNLQEQVNHMRKTAWIRGVCRKIKLPLTRSLLEDLQGMKKVSLLRTAKRLALAHKVSKPKSGMRLFENKSSIPTGNDLYNWLQN